MKQRTRAWVAGVLLLGLVGVLAADDSGDGSAKLDSTRAVLSKWVETQQIISRERRDWQLGKEVLDQRIALLEGEIKELEGKIQKAETGIAEADLKRSELVTETKALDDASGMILDTIATFEIKTKKLLATLPDPIRDRVLPLSQRIPADPNKTERTVGERFQNVIGVLNEVNKFNNEITLASEIRELPGGATAEVKALYLGLGQAYYVTANGESAGIGRPTPDGWEWTAANELAPQITLAISILQDQEVPAYVPLPVEIR